VEDVKKLFNNNEKSIFNCYGEPPIEPQLDNNGFFYYDNSNWKHNLFCNNIARREQSSLYFEPILLDFLDSVNIPYKIIEPSNGKPDELFFKTSQYIKEVSTFADNRRLEELIETEIIDLEEFEKLDAIKRNHHSDLTEDETKKYLKKYWLRIFNFDGVCELDKDELRELLTYYYNPTDKTLIQKFRRFKLYLTRDIRDIKQQYNDNMNKHISDSKDIFDYWDIIDSNDEVILWVDDILKILHKSDSYLPRDLRQELKSIIPIDNIEDARPQIIEYVLNRYDKMKQILDIREPKMTYKNGKGKEILGIKDWSNRKLRGFLKSFFKNTMDYEFKTDTETEGTKNKATEYILKNTYHTLGKCQSRIFNYVSHSQIEVKKFNTLFK